LAEETCRGGLASATQLSFGVRWISREEK